MAKRKGSWNNQPSTDSGPWSCLSPIMTSDITNICNISDTEFLVAHDAKVNKYNQTLNTWDEIYNVKGYYNTYKTRLAYNDTSKKLYLIDKDNDQMHILDMNDDKPKVQRLSNVNIWSKDCHFIFAENDLHLIAGRSDDAHLIYNAQIKKFVRHLVYTDWQRNYYGGLIHLKSKRKMLFFGGWTDLHQCTDDIWEYSFQCTDKRWVLLERKLPIEVQVFGSVLTPDEQYIIILGGWAQNKGETDDIYIWDLENMDFRKSEIKCPKVGQYRACIMMDEVQEIVIYGYLRKCIEMNDENIPRDIVRMILKWCCNTFVHLLKRTDGEHWRIELSEIL